MIGDYWFRAVAVSFAGFALSYLAISFASWCVWRILRARIPQSRNFLFGLLAAPMLGSAAVVVFFVMPSFLFFEPDGVEPTSWILRAFASAGIGIAVTGVVRAIFAWLRTFRAISRWTAGAVAADRASELPILTTETMAPAAVVAGILRPRLLISSSTQEALTANELRLVVAHELEHARRRDNLRKLLLAANFVPFLREIEDEWLLASELAADRAAVANGYDACELAGALVKVSRLTCVQSRFATAFGATNPNVLAVRVQRLIAWSPEEPPRSKVWMADLSITLIGGAAGLLMVFSGNILSVVHRVSELLIN